MKDKKGIALMAIMLIVIAVVLLTSGCVTPGSVTSNVYGTMSIVAQTSTDTIYQVSSATALTTVDESSYSGGCLSTLGIWDGAEFSFSSIGCGGCVVAADDLWVSGLLICWGPDEGRLTSFGQCGAGVTSPCSMSGTATATRQPTAPETWVFDPEQPYEVVGHVIWVFVPEWDRWYLFEPNSPSNLVISLDEYNRITNPPMPSECGDEVCDQDENAESCPDDCIIIEPEPPPSNEMPYIPVISELFEFIGKFIESFMALFTG